LDIGNPSIFGERSNFARQAFWLEVTG